MVGRFLTVLCNKLKVLGRKNLWEAAWSCVASCVSCGPLHWRDMNLHACNRVSFFFVAQWCFPCSAIIRAVAGSNGVGNLWEKVIPFLFTFRPKQHICLERTNALFNVKIESICFYGQFSVFVKHSGAIVMFGVAHFIPRSTAFRCRISLHERRKDLEEKAPDRKLEIVLHCCVIFGSRRVGSHQVISFFFRNHRWNYFTSKNDQ